MNDWNKFDQTELPAIDNFYAKLSLKNISKDDHKHVRNVWNTFNIKNLGEYRDLMYNQILLNQQISLNNLEHYV